MNIFENFPDWNHDGVVNGCDAYLDYLIATGAFDGEYNDDEDD